MANERQKVNILMVDDNPSNLVALETVLESPNHNLVRASSGDEALRFLLNNDAAVILLDVHMPIIDGLETAELIRGRERTRNLPIIFLTAYDSAGGAYISRGYSLGAVDYIIKPIDPEALKSKVAVFVELYKKTEEVKRQAELLREQNIEIENANLQRLSRLIDLRQQLAAERDPQLVLQRVCDTAREAIGARHALIGVLEEDGETLRHFLTSGFDRETAIREGLPQISLNYLREQFGDRRSLRLAWPGGSAKGIYFPPGGEPPGSFIGAPILQQGRPCGWLFLGDKLGAREFSEADERFAVTLTQAIVFYENARLYSDLQRHAAALEQEIAERKRAEEERERMLEREQAARADAEAANRLKDEFLATVSHELRTPLNAMLGWLHLLRKGKLDPQNSNRALDTIERNARALNRLIDNLLDVSRIIVGKLRLDLQPADIAPAIEEAIESIRPAAEAKRVYLREVLEPVRELTCDANRLQQVIWNLVSNAVKFTPAGGSVEVSLKHQDDRIEIVVSDTGAGIAPEFLPYVFERFRQADGSTTRKHGGLGLGLAIVRYLVELHGGVVRAESSGEGQGATFTVSLPLVHRSETVNGSALPVWENPEIIPPDSYAALHGLRVLVVNSETTARELIASILAQCHVEVRVASDLAEGFDIFAAWQPDLLISEISTSEEGGLELIRRVRKLDPAQGGKVPAIALTAYYDAEARIRALNAGFQMHIPKPIEPEELVMTVASLASRLAQAQATSDVH